MKKTFAILLASTALAFGAGIPAWSAMHGAGLSTVGTDRDGLVRLADDDDHGDDDRGRSVRNGDDGDHHGDDDDDDDGREDDHGNGGSVIVNPAPAEAVAPPANGLFGSGAGPTVKVN